MFPIFNVTKMNFYAIQLVAYLAMAILFDPTDSFVVSTGRIQPKTFAPPTLPSGSRCKPCVGASSSVAENEEEPEVVIEIEDLSMSQIAELIEVTFIQACMQLAQGYVDVLKLFIVSVKSAYSRYGGRMSTVVDQVQACPVPTAGRPLVAEEVRLRTTWIYAVALLLDAIEYPKEKDARDGGEKGSTEDPVAMEVKATYGPMLAAVLELHASGGRLQTREFLEQQASFLPANIYDDDVQYAIVSQTIKVMWYTLVVLQEERLARGDSDDEPSPLSARPPIPRGSGIN